MEVKKYSGYICQKCNLIPLIQIIPNENNIKILSSCKCYVQYENIDSFIKNKYKKDIIDIKKISKDSIINQYDNYNDYLNEDKKDINSVIDKFYKIKEKMYKGGIDLKNKIIDIYKKKIDEVNEMYTKYINNNNKIILLIEQMIKSYELIKDNSSNILNLINNCNFNDYDKIKQLYINNDYYDLEFLSKNIKNFFKNEFIISCPIPSKLLKNRYFLYHYSSIKCFVEMDNSIGISCLNNSQNIIIYNLKDINKELLSFHAHLNKVNWIINSNYNHIISCGDDGLIKIWPTITEKYFSEKKNEPEKKIKYYDAHKLTNILLNPIYEYELDNKEISKIEKMLNLKESMFLASSKKVIFLFKYSIEKEKIQIELINTYNIDNLVDIYILQKDKIEIIVMYTQNCLYFINIPNFDVINKIKMKGMSKNNLVQINSNELLIVDNCFYFKIIDINKFKIKLTIKNGNSTDYLLNLNDGTIIQSSYYGIKRFLTKNMEELPDIIKFDNNNDYNDYYGYDYYTEKIDYMNKLKDGRIMLCHQSGKIELYKLQFN